MTPVEFDLLYFIQMCEEYGVNYYPRSEEFSVVNNLVERGFVKEDPTSPGSYVSAETY